MTPIEHHFKNIDHFRQIFSQTLVYQVLYKLIIINLMTIMKKLKIIICDNKWFTNIHFLVSHAYEDFFIFFLLFYSNYPIREDGTCSMLL